MSLSIVEGDTFELIERVADLSFEGQSPTQIAKELSIPRKQVLILFSQYKEMLLADAEARDYARDHLYQMVKHYDKLIAAYYDLIGDLKDLTFTHNVAGQISTAIKGVGDLERQRLESLQKAGLLEASDLGDELAEREEREAQLIDILRNDLCNKCKGVVAQRLSALTNTVEVVQVYDDAGHVGFDE